MKTAALIGAGGFLGALARHYLTIWVERLQAESLFPWGILAANLLGCLAIGMMFGGIERIGAIPFEVRFFFITGFLGSFTTFSTFGFNTFDLMRRGELGLGLANVALSVVLGLAAVWAGYQVMASGKN